MSRGVPRRSPEDQRSEQLTELPPQLRDRLDTARHDSVGEHWAGGLPAQYGVAPKLRIGRDRWFNVLWLIPAVIVLGGVGILVARGLLTLPAVQDFVRTFPGRARFPTEPRRAFRHGCAGSTC